MSWLLANTCSGLVRSSAASTSASISIYTYAGELAKPIGPLRIAGVEFHCGWTCADFLVPGLLLGRDQDRRAEHRIRELWEPQQTGKAGDHELISGDFAVDSQD